MSADRKKLRERLRKLFAMMGSANPNESQAAQAKIRELLLANRMGWNDFVTLVQTGEQTAQGEDDPDDHGGAAAPADLTGHNLLDLLCDAIDSYLHFKLPQGQPRETATTCSDAGAVALHRSRHFPHQIVAIALWIMHTFVYRQFMITPRLAFLSPVRGCGKSTAIDLLEQLTPDPAKFDHATAAGVSHVIDDKQPTLLLDEADNLDLVGQPKIRAVLNSGHKRGGKTRIAAREFSTFAPAAFAAIGTLPAPLMQRSIVIHFERAPRNAALKRFDLENAAQMDILHNLYGEVFRWSRHVTLDRDPPMPAGLHNRRGDNWQVLIAIADACDRGELARKVALAMSREHQDEDPAVELLTDIRSVYARLGVDRLPGKTLVSELREIDGAIWSEWRGIGGDQQPRELSQAQLAALLRPFRIFSRSIWPTGPRLPGVRSGKGYYRAQFEAAWSSYCADAADADDGTAAQASNVTRLARN